MFIALYITDNRGETLELKLVDPHTNGIYIQNIEGLGYPQTNISSMKLATYDVALYSYQEVDERNIVLTLGLIGAQSVETSRHLLYDHLPIRYPVALEFVTDERVGLIHGYVETITPDIFNSQEAVQVSIICLDPYFYTGGSKASTIESLNKPNFQFDKWFTDGAKPVGHISDNMEVKINSRFQNPRGFQLLIHGKNGSFDKLEIKYENGSIVLNDRLLSIYNTEDKNFFKQYDDIIIKNDMSEASIKLYRDGEYTDLLHPIEVTEGEVTTILYKGAVVNGDFPQLKIGENTFTVNAYGLVYVYDTIMPRFIGEITNDELNSWNPILIEGHNDSGVSVDIPYNWSEVHFDFHWRNSEIITARWTVGDAKNKTVNYQEDPDTGYRYMYGVNDYFYQLYADIWTIKNIEKFPTNVPEPNDKNVFECEIFKSSEKARIAFYLVVEYRRGTLNSFLLEPKVQILNGESPYEWAKKNLRMQTGIYNRPSNPYVYVSCFETELSNQYKPILEGYEYQLANTNIDLVIQYDDRYEAM